MSKIFNAYFEKYMKRKEKFMSTGLFEYYNYRTQTLLKLIGTDFYYGAISNSWVGSKGELISFESVFESVPEDIKLKLIFHMDVVKD